MPSQIFTNYMHNRYSVFRNAVNGVLDALEESSKLIGRMSDRRAPAGGWTIPSVDEVKDIHRHAMAALDELNQSAKKWESELLSRGWRV